MDWYIRYIGIPIAVLTWLGIAWALLLIWWPLGIGAFVLGALLTEQLLARYASSKKPAVGRGTKPF